MKLINSSVLLAAVALSSMADRASAQMPSIEDVIAMISDGQVQGTDQPEEEPQSSSIVAETAPVRPVVTEEEEPQVYVAPEIENFSSAGESDVEADGVIDVVPPDPMPVPSAAPSSPPKPITCIDRSLEVRRIYCFFYHTQYNSMFLHCIVRFPDSVASSYTLLMTIAVWIYFHSLMLYLFALLLFGPLKL